MSKNTLSVYFLVQICIIYEVSLIVVNGLPVPQSSSIDIEDLDFEFPDENSSRLRDTIQQTFEISSPKTTTIFYGDNEPSSSPVLPNNKITKLYALLYNEKDIDELTTETTHKTPSLLPLRNFIINNGESRVKESSSLSSSSRTAVKQKLQNSQIIENLTTSVPSAAISNDIKKRPQKVPNPDFVFPDDEYLNYDDDKISASAIASIVG